MSAKRAGSLVTPCYWSEHGANRDGKWLGERDFKPKSRAELR